MGVGQRVGYKRISSAGQNSDRQLEGLELDRIFEEAMSGKNAADRPQFQEMLAYLRDSDCAYFHSMDRAARNLSDLLSLVSTLTARGVQVRFIKENLTFTGQDEPMSKLMLGMMGAFAEFERSLILERQREGIAIAKAKGVYKGRKPSLNRAKAEELRSRALAGEKKSALAREFKISRETLYSYIRDAY